MNINGCFIRSVSLAALAEALYKERGGGGAVAVLRELTRLAFIAGSWVHKLVTARVILG